MEGAYFVATSSTLITAVSSPDRRKRWLRWTPGLRALLLGTDPPGRVLDLIEQQPRGTGLAAPRHSRGSLW